MALSPLRSATTPMSRMSVHDAGSARPGNLQGGAEGPGGSGPMGLKRRTPGPEVLRQDGFDAGPGKGAELGRLLQDTLSALTSIVQLVAQAVPGGAQALQGAQGAQGAAGGKCGSGSPPFSDSSFTPKDAGRPPVALNGNTGVVGPGASQQATASQGGSKLGGNLPAGLEKFRGAIESASAKTGMPAEMLAAQIWQESRGNLEAVSTNGGNGLTDTGLMQVNPNTYGELQAKHPELQGKNLSDPETNILAGAFYMKDMKEQFGSDELALRAYNSGPNGVDKSNPDAIPAGTGDATYVQKVKSFMNTLATGQGTLPA
ncbi:lytic transglycosylase domain-containing protein [Corallococcus aberystwythensis]|uniref:Lytic transglycosylase domain-containing protein n=1 Tax=Corallococcus aberystwythensis TaxID=2316722 RepID=A0A3A8QHB1_9BACT|nr:transglycosylase SLT domain-containing protein [Corallococcus aberystwythensis]RKH67348.1 lytic transglycosylase domain-containing protein [Corallococcus aberystwythensis]